MKGSSLPDGARGPDRGNWDRLRTAAGAEAIRLGDREVGAEHLLLGVFAVDSTSVAALAKVGADLAVLRRAVRDQRRNDRVAEVVSREPTAVRVAPLDFLAARALPFGAGVKNLVDEALLGRSGRDALRALLDDGGCDRLLEQAGVEIDHLRAAAAETDGWVETAAARDASARWAAATGDEPRAVAGSSWVSADHTQLMPASSERVWAVVSDPVRHPEWDHRCAADDEPVEGTTSVTAHSDPEVRQVVVHSVPGRATPRTGFRGPGALVASTTLLQVEPGDRAAVLHLRTSVPARAGLGLLLRPLLRATMRGRLRFHAIGIAQAASEDRPSD